VVRSTTNPAPVLRCSKRPKNSNFIIFSIARWQHITARRQQSNLIAMSGDNKLTDPPTHLPELTLNLFRSSRGHSTPSLKISCKSVQPFSRNPADKKSIEPIPRPPGGVIRNRWQEQNGRACAHEHSWHAALINKETSDIFTSFCFWELPAQYHWFTFTYLC